MMNALLRTPEGLKRLEREIPKVTRADDVLIKVQSAAICRTDVFAANGTIPVDHGRILGHEFTGIVEEIGSSDTCLNVGSRVVVNPLIPCGRCAACKAAKHHHCADTRFMGIELDGAFAQFVVVPKSQVHPLPESVGFEVGAYAEPLAAVMAILEADLPRNEAIAVTGDGRIADLTSIILTDHGYQATRHSTREDHQDGFAAVVETDLVSNNAERILNLLKPGGLVVMKSRRPEEISLPPLLCIKRRLRIQAVHYAPFEQALDYLEQAKDQLQDFIGRTYTLDEYEQAFAAACEDESLKIYFTPNG